MNFLQYVTKNMLNIPLLCFLTGMGYSLLKSGLKPLPSLNKFLTLYILFSIGLKGGGPLIENLRNGTSIFFLIISVLVVWGLLSPLLSFYFLRKFTKVDISTAAAIAASLGSVSIMTCITAMSFLDQLEVNYQKLIIAALAIMEIPAIFSGILIAKMFDKNHSEPPSKISQLFKESLFNKAILAILLGITTGAIFNVCHADYVSEKLLLPFKFFLALFLFDMGIRVGIQRNHFRSFSWQLNLFGFYMPLIGGCFGLFLSYLLKLDVGTATLIAILSASASYIAVPAAMQVVLPQAKQAIYLPLSLGIVFPFNVLLGIPLYYSLACTFLK